MRKKVLVYRSLMFILLAVSVTFGVFIFNSSYMRLWESVVDLWHSLKYYFCELFSIQHGTVATVNEYSKIMNIKGFLPNNYEVFKTRLQTYLTLLISKENFEFWGENLTTWLTNLAVIVSVGIPIVFLVLKLIGRIYKRKNIKHNKDTKPLYMYKVVVKYTFLPLRRFVLGFIAYAKERKEFYISLMIIWILNFNLVAIVVSAIAYYLYFSISLSFLGLYKQFFKLFVDLQVILKFVPTWAWLLIGYMVFDKIRKKMAVAKLRHMEAQNCGFIKDLPIVSMTNGTMGKKKTTMITDMALSQEVMFRQKAFEILQNNDVKFPFFPWICFELELKACMRFKKIYNLATVKDFVDKKRVRFSKHKNTELQLYGYDIEKYGRIYNNGLYESDLFDVLETYAKAYFIYVIECSLIVANYSIREDNAKIDIGNFPMWAMDFFPEAFRENNRHAHILDFDTLRLGRKVIEDNPNAGSFEFGVVVITEIGKERGNNLELKEIKKNTEDTNQKNDLFNSWLKMCRHSATVDNFPFIKVFTDEQRPESWGADARDLCDIVNIIDSGVLKLAMPFYIIEEMLSEMVYNKFYEMYYDFRFRRGDNTLFMHLFKTVVAWLFNRNLRLYNKYGYSTLKVYKESGAQDGKRKEKKYYIMNMKTYRKRFTTDCFGDYFNELAKGTCIGLMDYIEYATEKASVEELKLQNSYFINSLYKDSGANSTS